MKKLIKRTLAETGDFMGEMAPSTISATTPEISKVDKLHISFPNEDLNKLVEKINEIVERI